jgi:hypothetical protein
MTHFFNTAGPCKADIHYMLPAAERLPEARRLIEQQGYFVLHAPRQTGKTTTMLELARSLTASGRYVAALVSAEVGAAFPDDVGLAEGAILGAWRGALSVRLPAMLQPPPWPVAEPGQRIQTALRAWAQAAPRPLVLFIDEIDSLQGLTLISVLRQLRDGYNDRPNGFPHSIALIGLRDVRDYKVASGGTERLNTASPFNIKLRSLTLESFTAVEVATLYAQHTAETGQSFEPEAVAHAYERTQGQPWLVNALAKVAVEELVVDLSAPITVNAIEQAKEILIARQETHLDSLAERLREPRVRQIIEPMMAGLSTVQDLPQDDVRFLQDLGLVRMDEQRGTLVIANPIYREIIPTVLSYTARTFMPSIRPTWLRADGSLDSEKLLEAFLVFWRQHGQPLMRSAPYPEIAPHLVLMAFLHRVVNGGGSLEREYAIGTGRMDLCLRYGNLTLGIELKVWRNDERDPLAAGLEQLDNYLAGLGQETGWLVIFDRRSEQPPIAERTGATPVMTPAGRSIVLIRA